MGFVSFCPSPLLSFPLDQISSSYSERDGCWCSGACRGGGTGGQERRFLWTDLWRWDTSLHLFLDSSTKSTKYTLTKLSIDKWNPPLTCGIDSSLCFQIIFTRFISDLDSSIILPADGHSDGLPGNLSRWPLWVLFTCRIMGITPA